MDLKLSIANRRRNRGESNGIQTRNKRLAEKNRQVY